MADTHKVVRGDTLSEIAVKYYKTYGYSDWNSYMNKLIALNRIRNKDLIYIGQVLKLSGTVTTKTNKPKVPEIEHFGIQVGTDRRLYVAWYWKVPDGYSSSTLDHYEVTWEYRTKDNKGNASIWFTNNPVSVPAGIDQNLYDAPDNAWQVRVSVKPISKTKTSGNNTTHYWSVARSTYRYQAFIDPPPKPNKPELAVQDDKLIVVTTVPFEEAPQSTSQYQVEFQLYKNDSYTGTSKKAPVKATYESETNFTIGKTSDEYKVCCRTVVINDTKNPSDWSDFSEAKEGLPESPGVITECRATSKTSVFLKWEGIKTGLLSSSYKIQYTTNPRYFDGSDAVTTVSDVKQAQYEITGLETGQEYFFRVCANNLIGDSDWTDIVSVVLGSKASIPTTWSSSTTVIAGENLVLHWMHNAEDNSRQSKAELEISIGGNLGTEIFETPENAEDEDIVSSFTIDTSSYTEGTEIQWRVRTMGVIQEYGDWSIQRTVTVYAQPTLEVLARNIDGETFSELDYLPFTVSATHTPVTQTVIGYHVSIIAKTAHEITDETGNVKMVPANGEVFSKYVDTSEPLSLQISADNVTLVNNVDYTIHCIASLDSGLTAEDSWDFTVAWGDEDYVPNAEVGIDFDALTATIQPYCVDDADVFVEDMTLSVYRREQDGSLVEIATGIENDGMTTVTDPHPSLDYARYRIVARLNATGQVIYNDLPGVEVEHSAVVIQWDEQWKSFDHPQFYEGDVATPVWGGSMIKLPYNVDVSSDYQTDATLANYIGRKYPVSYFGTQVEETLSINTEVVATDLNTIYALRRLAKWTGNVYIRVPSGVGFWATVTVNMSEGYNTVTVPVSLKVVRVEGGM